MSKLLEQIRSDQLQSRKAKDKLKSKLLTTLLGEASPSGNDTVTDDDVLKVVKKFCKNCEETLKVKYSDDVHTELCILSEYLPANPTAEQLVELFDEEIHTSMGLYMKAARQFCKDNGLLFDGNDANQTYRAMTAGGC